MEDPGDGTADLAAAIPDTWSWARADARTGARDVAEPTRVLGQLTSVDLR